MKRDRKEYRDRLLYESRLHKEHVAARANQAAMEHGDDDSQSDPTPTKEQMYLDIIKELRESNEELKHKIEEAETKRQESASQQSLDRLLEMLASKESSIENLTEELRLSREKSAEQQKQSAEQIRILQEKSAAEIKSLHNELTSFRVAMERLIVNKDAELQLLRNQLYGKKSQKGRRTKKSKVQGCTDVRFSSQLFCRSNRQALPDRDV